MFAEEKEEGKQEIEKKVESKIEIIKKGIDDASLFVSF